MMPSRPLGTLPSITRMMSLTGKTTSIRPIRGCGSLGARLSNGFDVGVDGETGSRRCGSAGSAAGLCQLQEIVGGADHRPLAPDLIETAHQELSKASGLLDLPEHRLDHLLPEAVAAPAASPLQAGSHRAHQGHLRQFPAGGRLPLPLTAPARRA